LLTINEFYSWEVKSRQTIDVKPVYIDLADDLPAGVLLSQIIYWHLPDINGKSKLRVFHNNKYWIAKKREEWWDEVRLKPRQVDRAIEILIKKKLIEKEIHKFNNLTMLHIRLNEDEFLKQLENALHVNPESPIRDSKATNSPIRESKITNSLNLVTENTTENTFTKSTTNGQNDFFKKRRSLLDTSKEVYKLFYRWQPHLKEMLDKDEETVELYLQIIDKVLFHVDIATIKNAMLLVETAPYYQNGRYKTIEWFFNLDKPIGHIVQTVARIRKDANGAHHAPQKAQENNDFADEMAKLKQQKQQRLSGGGSDGE